jgi:murein DD-endopeptidase MepM/ murein hydrolase activator NlpD
VAQGETLLGIAARYNLLPSTITAANHLPYPAYLFPGQRLRIPGEQPYHFLSGEWMDVQIRPLPITQGSTVSIYVKNLLTGIPTGHLAGQLLHFTPYQDGFMALVGLDAFTPTGLHSLELGGSGDRPWRPFQQNVQVQSGGYGTQYITVGEELSDLLDPTIRQEEDIFLSTIFSRFSETQLWEGLFQVPVTSTIVTAGYGDGRSYNSGPIEIFHTGVDFAGSIGTPIHAPANGIVVFNNFLELRGNVLILDHGLGVMTAYFHLSDTFVVERDTVTTGQIIGVGGSTGLSTGAHLHWDLRISNIPVNPMQWTTEVFP